VVLSIAEPAQKKPNKKFGFIIGISLLIKKPLLYSPLLINPKLLASSSLPKEKSQK